ncbi:MAG: hypothetical protein ABI585_00075 [Betaproteobacteria bacterium]
MKRTALEKVEAMKTVGAMKREPTSGRYGADAGAPAGKREQRDKDKAAGLVPFAVKLPQELVASLQALAQQKSATLGDLVAELLHKAMKAKK